MTKILWGHLSLSARFSIALAPRIARLGGGRGNSRGKSCNQSEVKARREPFKFITASQKFTSSITFCDIRITMGQMHLVFYGKIIETEQKKI